MDKERQIISTLEPNSIEWNTIWKEYPNLRDFMRQRGREYRILNKVKPNKYGLKPNFLFLEPFFIKLDELKEEFIEDIKIDIQLKLILDSNKKKNVYVKIHPQKPYDYMNRSTGAFLFNRLQNISCSVSPAWMNLVTNANFIICRFEQ